ncbi:MAG: hypothetical protein IT385_09380 [Deltaproteobacteria bacterium]|nr:hypothetical protein [Deltaproteobacteria bacterium]
MRPHLSALVDGELEPLEAIAVQGHVRQSAELGAEVRELERLKLAVHLAGTRDKAPEALRTRLEAQCREALRAEHERRARWRWALPLGGLAAAAVALAVTLGGGAPAPAGPELASRSVKPVRVDGATEVLARLVDVHRGDASAMALKSLQNDGVLLTVERVPDGFVEAGGNRPKLVQTSSMGCNERDGGSTLAVLDGTRIDLPTTIDNALEINGVYLDTIDGVEVRLSTSGGKVFVILSGDGRSTSADPI